MRSRGSRRCSRGAATTSISLAVGPTERPDISRLTLRVDCSEHSFEQIEKQMHKLVDVLRVDRAAAGRVGRARARADHRRRAPDKRAEMIALGEVFGARVADIGRDALTFEVVGRPEELDAFEELVRPHGVRELARTGRIGLRRPGARRARSPPPSPKRKEPPHGEVIKTETSPPLGQGRGPRLRQPGHAHALNLADSGIEVEVGLGPAAPRARPPRRPG